MTILKMLKTKTSPATRQSCYEKNQLLHAEEHGTEQLIVHDITLTEGWYKTKTAKWVSFKVTPSPSYSFWVHYFTAIFWMPISWWNEQEKGGVDFMKVVLR